VSEQPVISIIVLAFNQRDKTLRCLANIFDTQATPVHVVVWDNGSVDGTVEAVGMEFPRVLVHHHPENLGVAGGRNAAARLAVEAVRSEYLLFLDNDMELEPDFVSELLALFEDDDTVRQTQAKLRFMDDRSTLNDGGGCDISFVLGRTRPVGYGEIDEGQYDHVRTCVACGGAMMVRTDIFEELGGFDETFSPFGPEDLDFSLRLTKAGYKALFVPNAVAYHEVSHTIGADYDAVYARNKIRHWLVLLRRHAPRWKIVVFFLITAPWLLLRAVVREALRGNFAALGGLARGLWDLVSKARTPGRTEKSDGGDLPLEPESQPDRNPESRHRAHE
jgi:GT2 family glycosyltransferase